MLEKRAERTPRAGGSAGPAGAAATLAAASERRALAVRRKLRLVIQQGNVGAQYRVVAWPYVLLDSPDQLRKISGISHFTDRDRIDIHLLHSVDRDA